MPIGTVHLKTLLPLVMPSTPRISRLVAAFHLREAAIRFCEMTQCWRHEFSQPFRATEAELVVPDYASTHSIEYVRWQRTTVPEDFVDLEPLPWIDAQARGVHAVNAEPEWFTQSRDGFIQAVPVPTSADAVTGTLDGAVFLRPRRGVSYGQSPDGDRIDDMDSTDNYFDRVPDYVADRHGAAIAHGALARLLALPEVEVRKGRDAAYYAQMFDRAINETSSRSFVGEQRARVRSRLSLF